jgi:hypothetical protein
VKATINKTTTFGNISSVLLLYILCAAGFGVFFTALSEQKFHLIAFQILIYAVSYYFRKFVKTKVNKNTSEVFMFFLAGSLMVYIVNFLIPNHPSIVFLPEKLFLGLGNAVFFLLAASFLNKIENNLYALVYIICILALLKASCIQEWSTTNDIWVYVLFGAPLLRVVNIMFPVFAILKDKS